MSSCQPSEAQTVSLQNTVTPCTVKEISNEAELPYTSAPVQDCMFTILQYALILNAVVILCYMNRHFDNVLISFHDFCFFFIFILTVTSCQKFSSGK